MGSVVSAPVSLAVLFSGEGGSDMVREGGEEGGGEG